MAVVHTCGAILQRLDPNIVAVLHSGGLDSTVCLLMALELGRSVHSIGIDYGQRHSVELKYAEAQCAMYGVERTVLYARWNKPNRTIPTGRSAVVIRESGVSTAFLPGRNLVFLALGVAEAIRLRASEIWVGLNSIDFSGYPDCTTEFIMAFQAASNIAIPQGPRIVAPLQTRSKQEIASEGRRLGLRSSDTWSCYRPVDSIDGVIPCSECDACVLHRVAWND